MSSDFKLTYWDIRTVSEMVEEQLIPPITRLIMKYLNIPYCKRTLKEQKKALYSPLTNVVWFEDFFSCNKEGFVTSAVNPYSESEMQCLVHMIRWENNQPDRQNRVVVFQPEKVIVNGEETPLTLDLIELFSKNSQSFASQFDYVVSEVTTEQRNAPCGPACCYSIAKKVHSETRNRSFEEQETIIKNEGDQVPSPSQAVLANFGWHSKSKEYIHSSKPLIYTWTDSFTPDGKYRLFVGGFGWTGLDIGIPLDLSSYNKLRLSGVRELSKSLKKP